MDEGMAEPNGRSSDEIRLIRTALKVPVQRWALAYLRQRAPAFLEKLRTNNQTERFIFAFGNAAATTIAISTSRPRCLG